MIEGLLSVFESFVRFSLQIPWDSFQNKDFEKFLLNAWGIDVIDYSDL